MPDTSRPPTPAGYMLLTIAEYDRLCEAAKCDDTLLWCEVCGAWIEIDDPAACSADGFTGCWKAATRKSRDEHLCRSWRAPERAPGEKGEG